MTWFKVDDKLHSHAKAVRAGVDAIGLWVLCGSWAMDQHSDGFVPDYVALRIDPKARRRADKLVASGLWVATERNGDKGWLFHDWEEYQPSAEDVMAKRQAQSEGSREGNHRRWHLDRGVRVASCPLCLLDQSTHQLPDQSTDRGTESVGNPPEPDPYPTMTNVIVGADKPRRSTTRGSRLASDFTPSPASRSTILTDYPMLDLRREHARFVDYWMAQPGQKGTKVDWDATWRNWMRRAGDDVRGGAFRPTTKADQNRAIFDRADERARQSEPRVIL